MLFWGSKGGGQHLKVRQRLEALDAENTSLARYITGEPAERAERWTDKWDLDQMRAGVPPEVIYGVRQFIQKVPRENLRTGTVFDLRTGWNLRRAEDRRKLWSVLEEEDPWVVIGSPMCLTPGQLAEYKDPAKKKLTLQESVEHLLFVSEVYKWQSDRGKHFVHEQRAKSVAWDWSSMKKVMSLPEVRTVTCSNKHLKGGQRMEPVNLCLTLRAWCRRLADSVMGRCHRRQTAG